jgi:O-antigen ligase
MGLIPFTIAVLVVPVFDTLRVMFTRIIRGRSPFSPDKTHLHHMFIDLGFSHVGTTISILSLNFMVVVLWYISYLIGAPEELQFFIVITMGLLITVVFYTFAEKQLKNNGRSLRTLKRISKALNIEKKGMWLKVQELIDKL